MIWRRKIFDQHLKSFTLILHGLVTPKIVYIKSLIACVLIYINCFLTVGKRNLLSNPSNWALRHLLLNIRYFLFIY